MAKQETVVETVQMEDGRTVDFPGKRNIQRELIVNGSQAQVRFDFRNGQTRLFTVPDSLLLKFAAHGASQKLGDEAAGLTDLDDVVMAIDELIDRLYQGEWTQKRESNGMAGASVLAKALVETTGKTMEQIKAWLKTKSHAEKQALRTNPKIKPTVDRIEAEKASKATKVDTDTILGELDAI